jgi:HK97 family phage prohead protease
MNDRVATLAGRRSAAAAGTLEAITGQARRQGFSGQIRATKVKKDGKEFVELDGYATVFNTPYPMWDWYGEYDEQVATTALDKTLAQNPDVAFLLNHAGMTMARTASGNLTLTADEIGLRSVALVNPLRSDVQDLIHAIDDEDIDQMSFAFRIVNGRWNEEFTMYTITEVDIDRGDVSAVNFGANPYTSISARAQQVLDGIEHLGGAPLEAAMKRASARVAELRTAEEPEPDVATGMNAATAIALIALQDEH